MRNSTRTAALLYVSSQHKALIHTPPQDQNCKSFQVFTEPIYTCDCARSLIVQFNEDISAEATGTKIHQWLREL